MIGEALEKMRLVRPDAQMLKLRLRLGPGERGHAFERRGVKMLLARLSTSSREAATRVQNATWAVAPRGRSRAGAG